MKFSFGTLALAATLFLAQLTALPVFASNDCDCPAVSCGPCKDQVNLEFYTEKCGGGKKVKSCKRPICADKDPMPEMCVAGGTATPVPAKPSKTEKSVTKPSQKAAGTLVVAVGEAYIHRSGGEKQPAKMALKVFEGDTVETGANGKLVVKLTNDNTINLTPNSKALIKIHDTNEATHTTLIDLMYGTVRSAVKKAPKDAKNDFKVKTKSAVAGVRGTDFVTSYTDKVGITKVETLHGLVELSSPSGSHKVDVPKGTYASYVVPSGASSIGDDDIERYVERGYMTEAQKLSAQDILKIEEETEFAEKPVVAVKKKQPICHGPEGMLNQCSWTTDSSSGKCYRKRCNANGEWAEETRLPANMSEHCGQKSVIAPCDY